MEAAARLWKSAAMKHRNKWLLAVAAVVVAVVVASLVHHPKTKRSAVLLGKDQSHDATIRRGEYLARIGDCIACHTKHDGQAFAGGLPLPTPFGTLYSPNITPHAEFGIGQYSASEFYDMLHTGRSRTGELLYPAMHFPAYRRVPRADSDANFAY